MDERVEQVAAGLHEAWRAPRRLPDGTFEERVKEDGRGGVVDIANTEYALLPPVWQEENRAAASSVVSSILELSSCGVADLEAVSARVHEDWLERNSSWAPAEQSVPYEELSEVERQKDREVALLAASVMGVRLV